MRVAPTRLLKGTGRRPRRRAPARLVVLNGTQLGDGRRLRELSLHEASRHVTDASSALFSTFVVLFFHRLPGFSDGFVVGPLRRRAAAPSRRCVVVCRRKRNISGASFLWVRCAAKRHVPPWNVL